MALIIKLSSELPVGFFRQTTAQAKPLPGLVAKFGSGLSAEMLEINNDAYNNFGGPCHHFCGGLPTGMLMTDGNSDSVFGNPGHQVWQRASCGEAEGRRMGPLVLRLLTC